MQEAKYLNEWVRPHKVISDICVSLLLKKRY